MGGRAIKERETLAKEKGQSEDSHDGGEERTLVVSGSARLPKEFVGQGGSDRLWLELELKEVDLTIVDFSCTTLSRLGKKILRHALLGEPIKKGIERAVKELEKRFFGTIRKAIIAALEDSLVSYERIKNGS